MDAYTLSPVELTAALSDDPEKPEPAYRVDQVRQWLARGVEDPGEMTDLPARLRERLAAALDPPARVLSVSSADQGLTRKILLDCHGEAVESVLMLYPARGRSSARATVCVSTQAGCAMGCPFCATGQAGFRGQIGSGDIVRQVTVMERLLREGAPGVPAVQAPGVPERVTDVVFMGMGEPLANLDATLAAVRWLTEPREGGGFGLSARAITVSTVGLVPGIRRLAELGLPIRLAVSLHAATDALRDDLVPVNRQHPLAELLRACREYVATTRRRLTLEYVLIDGINAGPADARALADLVRDAFPGRVPGGPPSPRPHVNLIPMNPTPAVPWRAPSAAAQRAFLAVLNQAGLPATLRRTRGTEIDAACGQLYANYAVGSGRTLSAASGADRRVEAAVTP